MEDSWNTRTFTLAYEVTVEKQTGDGSGPRQFTFFVDAATGVILNAPTKAPYGIIR